VIAQERLRARCGAGAVDVWAGIWLGVVSYALERVVAKEWKPGDAGVELVIEGAWEPLARRPRRSSSNAISGGTKIRIGTPTTPMPRLTYS